MNSRTIACDHRRIDVFLDSNRVGLEYEQLLEHLNTCTACREYMETRAADSDSWSSAARLLQPGEFDHASSDEYSLATTGTGRVDPPAAIQSVLDLLAPAEDPNRLGRLGTYEVSGVIGAGGMGVVLKAFDPALDRVVAIKVMAPHLANNGTARKRFSREAKAAAAVLHPNVIPIYSVSSDEKIPYLVMAYIRGGSLQKRLDREGPLSTIEILRIGSQVAAGLAAAHEQGLVHRDVKPENILLEEGVERITLTDFGLARAVDDASVTQPGTIAGTPQYMSPEQTRGESIDQQSDLFSLGCVLYALCTGRPPFRAESSYAVMRKISDESPMPIRELNPEIPEWLCGIIDKLMAKKKADRFKSADEVHELLETCLSHVQQPATNPLPGNLTKSRQRRFSPVAKSLLGVFSMVTVTAAIYILGTLLTGTPPSDPATSAPSNGARNVSEDEQATAISQKEARLQKIVKDNPIVVRVKLETGSFTGAMNLHRVIVQEVYKGKADNVQAVFAHFTGEDLPLPVRAEPDKPRMPTLKPGEYVLVLEAKPVTHSSAVSSLGLRITPEESFNYIIARDSDRHAAWPVGSPEAEQVLALCGREGAGRSVDDPQVNGIEGNPNRLKDGEYTLQITHTAKHPNVRFPTDAIPEAEYKKVDEPTSKVLFSDDLTTLKLVGIGGIGALESRAGDTLVYTFDRGLDASAGPPAQVIVKQTERGLTVTLTQFGSGVPVIVSHQGTLKLPVAPTPPEEKAKAYLKKAQRLEEQGDFASAADAYLAAYRLAPRMFHEDHLPTIVNARRTGELVELFTVAQTKSFYSYVADHVLRKLLANESTRSAGNDLLRNLWEIKSSSNALTPHYLLTSKPDEIWTYVPDPDYYLRSKLIPDNISLEGGGWGRFKIEGVYELSEEPGWGYPLSLRTLLKDKAVVRKLAEEVEATVEQHPDWKSGRAVLAVLEANAGNYGKATELISQVLADAKIRPIPSDSAFVFGMALEGMNAELDQQVMRLYESSLKNRPPRVYRASAIPKLGRLYAKYGKREEARQALYRLTDVDYDPSGSAVICTPGRRPQNHGRCIGCHSGKSNLIDVVVMANNLTDIGYPVDAFISLSRIDQSFSNAYGSDDAWAKSTIPEDFYSEIDRGRTKFVPAKKKAEDQITSELVLQSLKSGAFANNYNGSRAQEGASITIDLMPSVRGENGKSTLFSPVVDALKRAISSKGDKAALANVQIDQLLSEEFHKNPEDMEIGIAATLFAFLRNDLDDAEERCRELGKLVRFKQLQQDDIALWLVARVALKHESTKVFGDELTSRALAAAEKQSNPHWKEALSRELAEAFPDHR